MSKPPIHIVIPAAGDGQRFKDAGYELPKPFIDVFGKPMIERVEMNLRPYGMTHQVHILFKEDLKRPSSGALETIMQADFDLEGPLIIANCDQLVAFHKSVHDLIDCPYDGALVVFKSNKPHHSYVETKDGVITRIVEKEVISSTAVTGVYYFKHARDFYDAAMEVISRDEKVNGEFYVSSAIAKMIEDGSKLVAYEAPSAMLGTPEELQLFEAAVKVARELQI